MDSSIVTFNFVKPFLDENSKPLADYEMGTNWPVVYILHGNLQIYIGETNSAANRMEQHADPEGKYYQKRKYINKVEVVFNPTFNKSAILDIENSLINLFRYEIVQKKQSKYLTCLQNGNSGQSKMHNYYRRAHYQQEVENIWDKLCEMNIATVSYQDIVNDTIFKYSPYTSLNEEQKEICYKILDGIMDTLFAIKEGKDADYTAIVKGLAGTGKTIVLLNMLTRIVDAVGSNQTDFEDVDNDDAYESVLDSEELSMSNKLIDKIKRYTTKYGKPKIAYVAQMTALRNTIGGVFILIKGLKRQDAKGPNDIVRQSFIYKQGTESFEPFDIVFVDETHRLWRYKKIGTSMKAYKNACQKLFGENVDPSDVTTLDWIFKCSKTRVLVYDEFQTVKESDIRPEQFRRTLSQRTPDSIHDFYLRQQMRCRAEQDYVTYLSNLFECNPQIKLANFEDYELKSFDDPNELIEQICLKNDTFGLCRVTAGYGWQWVSKRYDECNRKYHKYLAANNLIDNRKRQLDFYLDHLSVEDGVVEFSGRKYVRNMDYNWIIKGDPHEIGCIHTSQGYDLNYVGVLFGPEIDYKEGEGIFINPKLVKDKGVDSNFKGLKGEDLIKVQNGLRDYILNSYKVMMTRGIRGCYVWAYNKGLNDYLKKLIR